jgi:hypothetical protein
MRPCRFKLGQLVELRLLFLYQNKLEGEAALITPSDDVDDGGRQHSLRAGTAERAASDELVICSQVKSASTIATLRK